jgi:hypothetical protein
MYPHSHPFTPPENLEGDRETIYRFIRDQTYGAATHTASDVIYKLLVDQQAPPRVRESLQRLVEHPSFSQKQGLLFINRCLYTAINPLHLDVARHGDIKTLVQRLSHAPDSAQNPTTRRLRRTLKVYIQDDMYQCVRRQARLDRPVPSNQETVLGDLFPSYSFLYLPATLTPDIQHLNEDEPASERQRRSLTSGIARRKENKIYQTRQQLGTYWGQRHRGEASQASNPTRLSNQDLDLGIKLYHTRRPDSFRERAAQFSQRYRPEASVSECRSEVLGYMKQPLKLLPPEPRRTLEERFERSLITMGDGDGIMRSTVIQAFKKILDELMFAGYEPLQANRFLKRYVQQVSPPKFAAILLNLVLGCPMILYKLEERLTALYLHFETTAVSSLSWLVQFFEYMHLALVMNFRYLSTHDNRDNGSIPPSILLLG